MTISADDALPQDVTAPCEETNGIDPRECADKIQRPSVEFNLTEHCNLSCYACAHFSPIFPTKFAAVQDFSNDFRALAQVFHSEELRILGGEPLLHPQLIDFLTEARRIGVADSISLHTNGVLLHEVPEIFWQLIDKLHISVYPGIRRRFDDDKCAEICSAHNIHLHIERTDKFFQVTINTKIDDPNLVNIIHRDCKQRDYWSCHTVLDGHFFKCTVAAFTRARLALSGIVFDDSLDGVPLHNNPNLLAELRGYLNASTPLAACAYCLGDSGPLVAHRQLNGRGRLEWLMEDNAWDIETTRNRLLDRQSC